MSREVALFAARAAAPLLRAVVPVPEGNAKGNTGTGSGPGSASTSIWGVQNAREAANLLVALLEPPPPHHHHPAVLLAWARALRVLPHHTLVTPTVVTTMSGGGGNSNHVGGHLSSSQGSSPLSLLTVLAAAVAAGGASAPAAIAALKALLLARPDQFHDQLRLSAAVHLFVGILTGHVDYPIGASTLSLSHLPPSPPTPTPTSDPSTSPPPGTTPAPARAPAPSSMNHPTAGSSSTSYVVLPYLAYTDRRVTMEALAHLVASLSSPTAIQSTLDQILRAYIAAQGALEAALIRAHPSHRSDPDSSRGHGHGHDHGRSRGFVGVEDMDVVRSEHLRLCGVAIGVMARAGPAISAYATAGVVDPASLFLTHLNPVLSNLVTSNHGHPHQPPNGDVSSSGNRTSTNAGRDDTPSQQLAGAVCDLLRAVLDAWGASAPPGGASDAVLGLALDLFTRCRTPSALGVLGTAIEHLGPRAAPEMEAAMGRTFEMVVDFSLRALSHEGNPSDSGMPGSGSKGSFVDLGEMDGWVEALFQCAIQVR